MEINFSGRRGEIQEKLQVTQWVVDPLVEKRIAYALRWLKEMELERRNSTAERVTWSMGEGQGRQKRKSSSQRNCYFLYETSHIAK
jgi:hypothetical protein